MDEKISVRAVEEYSEAFASKVTGHFFKEKDKITGPEILNLCELKQINLFIIRELMHAWKVESQKLKSPYFNYQDPEVAEALIQFQNILSNHISIARNDFFPLLKAAVGQTVFIVLDPYDFYSDTLDSKGERPLQLADLRNDLKYLKINRAPLEKLVQKLEEKKLSSVSGNEAFALLDSILEEVNFTPEDIDGYVSGFSKVLPLAIDKLYDQKMPARPEAKQEEKRPKVAVVAVNEPKPAVTNFQRIANIKDNLTINQKFMFTKILFNGDFEIFSQAIDRLDSLDNISQAIAYLDAQYPEWDKESEEYLEFMDMVEKRFV